MNVELRRSDSRFSVLSAIAVAIAFAIVSGAGNAWAQDTQDEGSKSTEERVDALESQVKTIAGEISAAVTEAAVPKDGNWENYYGVGPVAGKVYRKDSGLSIGGYGEVFYKRDTINDAGEFDTLRAVLYVGYKFSDKWVLNSEIEFEHAGKSNTYVEFLNLDYQYSEALNFRVGLILNPMGFVNQIHEPTFYYGVDRPLVEKVMMPSTWREGGAGIYGRLGDRVSYQAYGVVSMDGAGFGAGGYRGGRQKGIGDWGLANNFSFTGRVDVDVFSGLMVGGSFYTGHQGQDQEAVGGTPVGDLQMTMYEIHAQYQRYGFHFRALFSQAYIDNPDTWNNSVIETDPGVFETRCAAAGACLASESQGWYIEGAYNVFSLLMPDSKQSLEPFLRYSQVNTQKAFQTAPTAQQLAAGQKFNLDVLTVGIQYKPIPQIVFKLDYLYEWGNESNID
ncbi:MAG: hypothetical protein CL917_05970, partial [Deltaproteobacteria bacterium]|nr:hypothetical protein [Deltaproteobacteria bacterium]